MKRGAKQVVCDVCGTAGARIRRVVETVGKGADLLVIENVPLAVCPHCGESYFTADTLHELERIRRHGPSFAVERAVKVATFVA
jgi:YgiT-type zinc finger domain-containing protein